MLRIHKLKQIMGTQHVRHKQVLDTIILEFDKNSGFYSCSNHHKNITFLKCQLRLLYPQDDIHHIFLP